MATRDGFAYASDTSYNRLQSINVPLLVFADGSNNTNIGPLRYISFMQGMDGEDEVVCRICRCEGETERPLFHPCKCNGTIKYVHNDCLLSWLRLSGKEKCEVKPFSYQGQRLSTR